MFAFGLMAAATLLEEISTSIGKSAVRRRIESVYALGFLSFFWASILMTTSVLLFDVEFRFSKDSLPFFLPRLVLEIVVAHFSVRAVAIADRSTYAFLRLLTIPLLIAADIIIGYTIQPWQILGALIIFGSLAILLGSHSLSRKGSSYVLITALTAVVSLSLFKYDITHFNSVAGEQLIVYLVLLTYFTAAGRYYLKENSWSYLRRALPEFQSFSQGAGNIIASFAYGLAPASLVVAASRGFSLLWAILFGNIYFHEKHIIFKLVTYSLIIIGLVVMIV